MKILLSFCLSLLLTTELLSQVAIIQDKDGYTNVRKGADVKSEIIYKLVDNEVFFYYEESFDSNVDNANWVYVMIPRNKFSTVTDSENPYYYGYIHRSRLRPLIQLEQVSQSNNHLIFQISKVDTLQKQVDSLIDGFIPYGLEVYLHQSWEVTSLDLSCDSRIFPQPAILTKDLYNVTFNEGEYRSSLHRFKTYKKAGVTFIQQECGDGAGYYQIVWVVQNQRIKQRLVGWIY